MCLVSYIPISTGYILSSNRDETPLRADTKIVHEIVNNKVLLYPKDQKGGSWIFLSNENSCICVLNGAFKKHERKLPYEMSRGLMMRYYFDFDNTQHFLSTFDFNNIEPFTMVIRDEKGLYEFRWDGLHKHIQILDIAKPYVWSSSTLYNQQIQQSRETLFFDLLDQSDQNLNAIQKIHLTGDIGDPESNFVMNRNNRVASISHTNAIVSSLGNYMAFRNLITDQEEKMSFPTV